MNLKIFFIFAIICLTCGVVLGQVSIDTRRPEKNTQVSIGGSGTVTDRKNHHFNLNIEASRKLYESKNKRTRIDAYGYGSKDFIRYQGHNIRTKPNYGAGIRFTHRFGRR